MVNVSGLPPEPSGYAELLEQLKARVRASQLRAARAANSELLHLYWSVGRDILNRQEQAGWGSRVIDRLAADLRAEFPDQRGWSRRNLHYSAPWLRRDRAPTQLCHTAWHNCRGGMFACCSTSSAPARSGTGTPRPRASTAGPADVLVHQVETRLAERVGSAPSNFAAALPRRTRSWRSSWCVTRTCSTTSRCPSGPWSASSSRR